MSKANKNTKTTSQGEKIKKFKMPKFPSGLVIMFGVLFFVMILSWIPHKGWVDTTAPLLYFNEEGLCLPNSNADWDYVLAKWDTDSINAISDFINDQTISDSLRLTLTPTGSFIIGKWLIFNNFLSPNDTKLIISAASNDGIILSNIVFGLENDWSAAQINYSGLSFSVFINDGTTNLVSSEIVIDKLNVSQILLEDKTDSTFIFTFNILSGSVNSLSGSLISGSLTTSVAKDPLVFVSENIADDWFNFFDSNYYVGDSYGRYGILNLPFLLVAGVFGGSGVILFMLCTGAFVQVMIQSKALESGTVSLVNKLKGKELLLIPIFFVLFCFIGTAAGMQAAVIGMVPLVVPFLVFAGFDTMTALLVIVVGNTSGIAASILDPFSVGVMSASLETVGPTTQVDLGIGILIRVIMFFVFAGVGSAACTWYGNRSRKGKEFVAEPEMYDANIEWAEEMLGDIKASHTGLTRRQAIGLGIFAATFGLMLFGLLPWTTWFEGLETADGWAAISSIFFAKVLFGQWFFVQISFMFLISGLILGRVFGMNQKQTNKAVVDGMKGMIGLGIILAVSRSAEIVLAYSGLTTGMIAMMFSGASGGGFGGLGLAWLLFPIFCMLAVFISSTSGLAAITGPIIAPILWGLASANSAMGASPEQTTALFLVYAAVIMAIYPLAQGIINMCMPTTGMVVVEAELARVNFGKAFKLLGIAAVAIGLIGMIIVSISIPIMMGNAEICLI